MLLGSVMLSQLVAVLYFIHPTFAWCPAGFVSRFNTKYYNGFCFALHSGDTWSEANRICSNSSEYGQLVRSNNVVLWRNIREMIQWRTIWTAGFTLNFTNATVTPALLNITTTLLPSASPAQNMSSLNSSDGSTQLESPRVSSMAENVSFTFTLARNAQWYWSDSSQPGIVSDSELVNGISSLGRYTPADATGPCLATSTHSWKPQDCSKLNPYVCQYPCIQRLNDDMSTFSSPNYPNYYPTNMNCEWFIDVGKGYAVLSFQSFRLEGSRGNCEYDYVEVSERKNSTRKLATLCGYLLPPQIKSPSQYLYIRMYTDSSEQYRGFRGTVQSSTIPTLNMVRAAQGVLTSPEFPMHYTNDGNMGWLVNVLQGRINLKFTDFELEPGNGTHCIHDALKIREGSSSGRLIGTYCSSNLPTNISVAGSSLYISLKTDGNVTHSGFRVIYWSSTEQCVRFLSHGGGSVQSPGFPSRFRGKCTWHIDVLAGVAKIKFSPMTTSYNYGYTSTSCSTSRLEILDGRGAIPRQLSVSCGLRPRRNVTALSRYLIIRFEVQSISYSYAAAKVFRATFRSTKNCSQVICASTGVVTSPDFPSYYDPFSNCTWLIDVLAGNVTLRFNSFQFQHHHRCEYDKFEVFDGNSTNDRLIGTFCGSTNPGLITSTSRYLLLRMTSDATIGSRGFSAEFWSSETTCTMWGVREIVTKKINNKCYGILKSKKIWSIARAFCEARHSSLLWLDNREEFDSVHQWLYREARLPTSTAVWTAGYRRVANGSTWLWSTINGDIRFDRNTIFWALGQPGQLTKYAYMKTNGLYGSNGLSSFYTVCEEKMNESVIPTSDKGCSPPPNIRAGYYRPPLGRYATGVNVTFHCDPEYVMVGHPTLTCKNHLWLGHAPICRVKTMATTTTPQPPRCSALPRVLYGELSVVSETYQEGSVVTVNCSPGYQLVNNHTLKCSNGRWLGTIPYCSKVPIGTTRAPKEGCMPPSAILYGKFHPSKNSYKHGDKLYMTCDLDTGELPDNRTLNCVQGSWIGTYPLAPCPVSIVTTHLPAEGCKPPSAVSHGRFHPSKNSYKHGDKLYMTCDLDTGGLPDNRTLNCVQGSWMGAYPLAPCPDNDKDPSSPVADKPTPRTLSQKQAEEKNHARLLAATLTVIGILTLVIIAGVAWQVIRHRRSKQTNKTNLLLEMQE